MHREGSLYRSDKTKVIQFCYDREVMARRIFDYLVTFNQSKDEITWEPGIRSLQARVLAVNLALIKLPNSDTLTAF